MPLVLPAQSPLEPVDDRFGVELPLAAKLNQLALDLARVGSAQTNRQ